MRIAIVNDMLLAVEALRRTIAASGAHRVAWVARDGFEAVERCKQDRPDLVLMDLIMPGLDGVEATRRIMTASPCAILVVTANMNESPGKVFEAMGAGALDAVSTPALGPGNGEGAKALLAKIESLRKLISIEDDVFRTNMGGAAAGAGDDRLVAIGASAGGPAALARVLSVLPADFPASVVIVQHVDVQFAAGLADWLGLHTRIPVRLAREDDSPRQGTVLLAGLEKHLVFSGSRRLSYTVQPEEISFHPSVDVFFNSVQRHWRGQVVALLLTGMGRDGAQGLKLLRQRGHHTIAQDQTSSAVFGMPKAAIELGAAAEVLPLEKIGARLVDLFMR